MSKFAEAAKSLGFGVSKGPFYQFHPKSGNRFSIIQGKPRFPVYDKDHLNNTLPQLVIEENDIVICSYYKTGTHWLKKILLEIMRHHEYTKNVERFQSIDLSNRMMANIDSGKANVEFVDEYPRIYHGHAHSDDFSRIQAVHNNAKLIYITRNPKDVAISMHSMLLNLPIVHYDGDYGTSIELFLNGFTPSGDFWDHVKGWNDVYNTSKYNMLWLYYEDILNDSLGSIEQIVKYIGFDDGGLTDDDYKSIQNNIQMNNMKKELNDNPGNFYENLDLTPDKFFRKGAQGDWTNYFDEKMNHYYDVKTLLKWCDNAEIKYYQEALQQNNGLEVFYE